MPGVLVTRTLRMPAATFYAVKFGRKTGIFSRWSGPNGAEDQVKGFKNSAPGSGFKKFSTLTQAEQWLKGEDSSLATLVKENGKVTKRGSRKHERSNPSTKQSPDVDGLLESLETESDRVVIYTDGCCKPSGCRGSTQKIAGIGVNFPGNEHLNVSKELSSAPFTNQRAELEAAITAIEVSDRNCFEKVLLYTDSKYVINGINDWIKTWKRNGWKTANKSDVLNKDLWVKLDAAIQLVDVKFVHVFGHTGVEGNEIADHLANKGAEKLIAQ